MEEHTLVSRGIAYRTNTHAPGKKTLLFIHGLSGSAAAWAEFEDYFAQNYNVITYDLRGHGLSVRPRYFAGYALPEFVADIDMLLQELRVGRVYIVAHSFGTLVAREYARRYPTEVAGMVLLAAPFGMRTNWQGYVRYAIFAARRVAELWPLSLPPGKRLNYRNWGYAPDFQVSRIIPEIYQMGVRSYLRCFTLQYTDTDRGWADIAAPILLVHGTHDHFVPVAQAHKLRSLIANAQLNLLQDANHMLVLNNVAEITQLVQTFVR